MGHPAELNKMQQLLLYYETSRAIELLKHLANSMALLLLTSNFDRMPDRDQMSCLQQSGATSTGTTLPQMIG